jgi:ribosomal protein S12 methylthiotransferase rimO
VDTEKLVTRLRVEGYEVASDYASADLVVVNTCAFIDAAVAESLDAIAEAMKENGRVLVIGCLGGKKAVDGGNWLAERFPDLIGVVGPDQVDRAMDLIRKALPAKLQRNESLDTPAGIKLTPSHYAYLKISEGCSHKCTFCIIPDLRGPLVSRPIGDVMREAENLVDSGVRELLVISQDTAAYGLDVHYKTGFVGTRPVKTRFLELAEELSRLDCWVRFHYVYPYPSVDAVLPLMAEGKILPYLDVPFQHAHPRILKAMKRPASAERNLDRIRAWRAVCPDVAIRSTFIVGFPGETEEEFEYLLDFLREARLDRVGCFSYSPVQGAKANALPDPVPEDVKEERRRRFMQVQSEISADNLKRRVGHVETVLIDSGNNGKGRAVGRSRYEAPDIDGLIYIDSDKPLYPGDLVRVRLTGSTEHDLTGVLNLTGGA